MPLEGPARVVRALVFGLFEMAEMEPVRALGSDPEGGLEDAQPGSRRARLVVFAPAGPSASSLSSLRFHETAPKYFGRVGQPSSKRRTRAFLTVR
jgi:hypothetical protein